MTTARPLPEEREILLCTVQVVRLDFPEQRARAQALLEEHHYLGGVQAVGEQMHSAHDIEQALLAHQRQVRGEPAPDEIVVLDGKEPKHSGGQNVVTTVSAPGLHYLGSGVVPEKTNEIPAVRDLCARLDLQGRLVSIDALHTQTQTAREVVLAHGADYLFTVKANQPGLQATVQAQVPDLGSPFLIP